MIRNMTRESTSGDMVYNRRRGLISLSELDTECLDKLIKRSCELHRNPQAHDSPLAGQIIGILFTTTSTRTRTAFTTGAIRLGGSVIPYGPGDLQTNTGESLEDTGRIFASMLDMLVARIAGPAQQLRWLSGGVLPVINAMSAEEHPTQGICDLAAMRMHFGSVQGLRVLYVGEGNNTAAALARGFAHLEGCRVTFLTPRGYGVSSQVLEECAQKAEKVNTVVAQIHSFTDLPDDVDVVYTTRWQTTGTTKVDLNWRDVFRPYHVDEGFMQRWPNAIFMHDLPAHRGEEVSTAVLEGKKSIAWLQASMKLSSAMAVLEEFAT